MIHFAKEILVGPENLADILQEVHDRDDYPVISICRLYSQSRPPGVTLPEWARTYAHKWYRLEFNTHILTVKAAEDLGAVVLSMFDYVELDANDNPVFDRDVQLSFGVTSVSDLLDRGYPYVLLFIETVFTGGLKHSIPGYVPRHKLTQYLNMVSIKELKGEVVYTTVWFQSEDLITVLTTKPSESGFLEWKFGDVDQYPLPDLKLSPGQFEHYSK